MNENSQSILVWGDATFGTVSDPVKLAIRAQAELDELVEAIAAEEKNEIAKEAADVAILLHRLMGFYGFDLGSEVDRKMTINRARQWEAAGDGTGSHSLKSPEE